MPRVNPFRLRVDERMYVVNLYGDFYYRKVAGRELTDPVRSCRANTRDWFPLDDPIEIDTPPEENDFIVLTPEKCGRCPEAAEVRIETRWHGHEALC